MAQHTPNSGSDQQHQEVWELLPWYVNRTLDAQELAQVEQHLARCPACQAEVTRCHDIATVVQRAEAPAPLSSPTRFAMLMAQIEATEAVGHPTRRWWATLCHILRRYGVLFSRTPRVARVVMAVEGALVLLLAAVLVWQMQSVPEALYTTLSRPMESPPQQQGQIRMVVADQMTAKELRDLLLGVQATIINGPSPLGVYTVAVPLVASTPDPLQRPTRGLPPGGHRVPLMVSTPDPLQPILEVFRAHPHVLWAERAATP